MNDQSTDKVAVIGAGTMGNGIAHVFGMHGHKVTLIDVSQDALTKALESIGKNLDRQLKAEKIDQETRDRTLSNISTLTTLKEGVSNADLVIEAISEDEKAKKDLFRELELYCPPNCILASNTSSISITRLAAVTKRPFHVIGMHFMNPVPVMPLVEIINGYDTGQKTLEHIWTLTKKLNKTPVESRDYPGFIANRILMPMINEAIHTLHEGIADVDSIDATMKQGMAHPLGPLQLADFIGLDICLSILRVLYEGFGNPKYAPCPLLVNMVEAGKLGAKSGIGFYDWRGDKKHPKVAGDF